MQVSGLEYTVKPDLTVEAVHILNPDGSIKVNLDNCKDDEEFTVVYDIFLTTGVAGLKDLKKDLENDPNIEFFEASRQDALYKYLTKYPQILDFETERIHKTEAQITCSV